MATVQQAKVKSVFSGDALSLIAVNNPRNERPLCLPYVTAPKLKREGDEPFAVESRDYLRRLVVGRVVQFRVLYTIPTAARRDFGTLHLQDGSQLPDVGLAEGWLKLRDDAGKREDNEDVLSYIEKLRALEARAKADEKGMWGKTTPISTSYELSDAQAFVQRWKGKVLDGVVEKVLSGDRVIMRLIESPTQHVQTLLLLAGIRAPQTKRVNTTDGKEQPGEPFGDEAQDFVETRLLQRGVKVRVVGVSPQNALIGTAEHPNGDITIFVLKAGLARCTDHHSTMLGPGMGALREAERSAREARVGLFKTATAPAAAASAKGGAGESDVVVSRIQSADTIFLRHPNGRELRVNLSSVRQPKPSDPKQSPFGAEAKEFMRKRLIGKHVRLAIDGKKPASEGYEEREMATITHNKENVALELVKHGFASVIRHRMDDQDRSPIYDDLLAAEEAAQKEGLGMWAAKAPEAKQYVDYSESLEKAKRLTTLLARQRRVPAIVDYVKGGSRFTLLIPRENAKITFVLSGIQAPRSARNASEASEPFGKEAHELASKRLQQRDVEIDVEDNDKVGGFIGKLYINRENFAKILLEEGYASVRAFSAEKSGNAAELNAAERKAKEAHKGLWQDWDPSQDEDGDGAGAADAGAGAARDGAAAWGSAASGTADGSAVQQAAPSKDYRDVVVTNVESSGRLKLQQISASTTGALQGLMSAFRSFHLTSSTGLAGPPKAGDLVAARFSEDKEWYRARVRRNDRDAKVAEVVYIDYGNAESVPWASLRPLGAGDERFGTGKLKAQALDAALSFVQFPADADTAGGGYMSEARAWLFQRLVNDRQLVARVDFTDPRDNTLWVTLFDPDLQSDPASASNAPASSAAASSEPGSVNAEVVEEGLGMVPRKLQRWERALGTVLAGLKAREGDAKDGRRGIWEYGDLTED